MDFALHRLLPRRPPAAPETGPVAVFLAQAAEQRRQWRHLITFEAVMLSLLCFLALAAVGAVVAVSLSSAQGTAPAIAWAAAAFALGLAVWHASTRLWHSRNLPRWAAGQVALVQGTLGAAEQLRSALDIAQLARRGTPFLGSPQLIERTLLDAHAGLAAVHEASRQLRARLWQLGLLLLLSVLAWTYSARAAPLMWRYLLRHPAQAAPPPREIGTLVSDSRLHAAPPPYARQAVQSRDEEGGDGDVLRGGRISVVAQPLPTFSVREVELETGPSGSAHLEVIPLQKGKERLAQVRWSRTVMEPLRYRYRGADVNGAPVREQGWREIRADEDAAPKVSIRKPIGEIEVRPGQTVQIDGEVSDDIGLSLVNLVIARPAAGVERRPVALAGSEAHAEVRESIGVDALQLRPGEVALVHVEAADNNPLESSRRGLSAKVRIRMFSAERHHAQNLEQLGEVAEMWTLRLGDRLERDPAQRQSGLSWALHNRADLAQEEQRGLDALRELRQSLADDVLSRPKTVADLQELEQQLGETLADEARATERIDPEGQGYGAVRDLYALQRHHALVLGTQEHAVFVLAGLASAEQQSALARDGKSLAEAEKQLVTTLEKLAEGSTAPLSAEAERLLDAVEQQLDRMAAAAQKQMRMVPYEHLNAAEIDTSGLQRDLGDHRQALGEVRQLLRAGKTREALDRLRQIQQQMSGRVADLQQGVERQRTAEEAALEQLVADLRRGIARAQQGEGQLRDDLRESSEEQERTTAEHLRGVRASLLPGTIALLQEARDQLRPQRLVTPTLHGHRSVSGARAALQTAVTALERGQIDSALQALTETEDLLAAAHQLLRDDIDDEEDPAQRARAAREAAADQNRLSTAEDRVQKASARLREALPSPASLLHGPTKQKLDQNALQQEQLRHALDKVRQKLGQAGGAHPALQRQVGDRLDHALQTMRDTDEALGRYDASRAFEETAETMDALEHAAALLESGGAGKQGETPHEEQVGVQAGAEAVELHGGNQGDATETFRQDVLRAMQQKPPAAWSERLQRYYKAIAR